MIQLNLLPGVKLEYLQAERNRRLVLSVAFIVTAASVALLIVLYSVDLLQKHHINNLNQTISSEAKDLKTKPQINQILTVQNQLNSLTALHTSKPASSRIFNYLNELTPAPVDISNFSIDNTQDTMTITGGADALASVNQYIDTLKLTTYTSGSVTNPTKAFSNIVLTNFSYSTSSTNNGKPATYTIGLVFDKNIFDITQSVTLNVPSTTTTRLEISNPSDLFSAQPGGGQ